MKPVSTGWRPEGPSTSTVLMWPPAQESFSKTVTRWRLLNSHAAESPAMPLPMTAISLPGENEETEESRNTETPPGWRNLRFRYGGSWRLDQHARIQRQ